METMGRRFNEQFVNHGRPEAIRSRAGFPGVSGGLRTVTVSAENIKEQHCPLCDGVHFRQLVRIFAMPKVLAADGGPAAAGGNVLAFVAVMSCRGCGWIMPNENTPSAVIDHGRLRSCGECGCECHEQCFSIGRSSRLVLGSASDRIVLSEVYFCARCGKLFQAERRGAATVDDAGEGKILKAEG